MAVYGAPWEKRLLVQVHDTIRLKHHSIRTEEAYVNWIRRFILFHDQHYPKDKGGKELDYPIAAVRAKESQHLPAVLTKGETQLVLVQLSGIHRLQAKLLYGLAVRSPLD